MTLSTFRLAFALSLSVTAGASTINFSANSLSGSCFATTYNSTSGGCQASGLSTSFTNAQGDTASIVWTAVTNSINFANGSTQPVNYGSFAVTYSPNGQDTNPVEILPVTFLMITREFSPSVVFYQPVLINFSGNQSASGQVGPGSADLQATFGPTTFGNGLDLTFSVPSSALVLNYGLTNNVVGQVQQLTGTPEPSTWMMIATSIPAFLIYRRRGGNASAATSHLT